MELAEDMLKYVIRHVLENCPDELGVLNKFVDKGCSSAWTHVATSDFGARDLYRGDRDPRETVGARSSSIPVSWGVDLQTEHERYPDRAATSRSRCS